VIEVLRELLVERWAFALTVVLMVIGLYGMLLKGNLVKKLIGLNIFQGGIILFYVVFAYRTDASIPIVDPALGTSAEAYMNPIPHGLMLTAIVVVVATSGVGLALVELIHRRFGTLEERELLDRMRE
jgi:multicomponent Na+:H+ antiporter subunit C